MTTLTDTQKTQIRIALAKWAGAKTWEAPWSECKIMTLETNSGWRVTKARPTKFGNDIPDYPASLDACHAIELKLTDEEHKRFEAQLRHLTKTSKGIICSDKDHRDFVSASTEHRSLALFRALNLGELGD